LNSEKSMIIILPLIRRLGISGITLFPFVILSDRSLKKSKRTLNHEQIHIRQQLELLVLFFYVVYLVEFGIGMIMYKNKYIAYKNISFEKEAYAHDHDLNYLKKRRLWAWMISH